MAEETTVTKNLWTEHLGKGFAAKQADYAIRASEDVNGNSLELTISNGTVTAIGGKSVGGGGGGSDIPAEGKVGQVLTKTQDGFGWEDAPVPDKGTFTIIPASVKTAYQSYIDVPSMPLQYNIVRGVLVLSGAFQVTSTFTPWHNSSDDPSSSLAHWTELLYWDVPESIDTSVIERSLLLGFTSTSPVNLHTFRLWFKSNETHRLVLGTMADISVDSNWYNIPDVIKIF